MWMLLLVKFTGDEALINFSTLINFSPLGVMGDGILRFLGGARFECIRGLAWVICTGAVGVISIKVEKVGAAEMMVFKAEVTRFFDIGM